MAVRSLKNSTLENFANYSSSMNAGYSFNDYELIESVFVASNTGSVTFNSLDQYATEYKHLQLRIVARSNSGQQYEDSIIRFNSDTGANYSWHGLTGTGSAAVSNSGVSTTFIPNYRVAGGSSSANIYGATIVDILDAYSTTKYKTTRLLQGYYVNVGRVDLFSGAWRNTSSITSISIAVTTGTAFVSGSRFSLYGVR